VAYKSYRLGLGGLNTKATQDAIPDTDLTSCRYCSFDHVGQLSSGRGRDKLNSDAAVAGSGSILGHFDGKVSGTKRRYTKRGADVYEDFTTDLGDLAALWPGRDVEAFSTTGYLTGFAYGDFVYLADGTSLGRWNRAESRMEPWGLTAAGYQELGADPVSTTSGDATVTITAPETIDSGMANASTQNIEFVGLEPTGGVIGPDLNGLHYSSSAFTGADVVVTGGPANGTKFTIEFQRLLAATNMTKIEIDTSNLTGGSVNAVWNNEQSGNNDPPTNDKQSYTLTGSFSGGSFRLKHEGYWTPDIAWNAAAATGTGTGPYDNIQAAMIALPNVGGTPTSSTAATKATATTITFEASANATSTDAAGGGSIAFMRQGPIVTVGVTSPTTGALEEGRYFYAYTFYNGVAESNFSAQVPAEVVTRNSTAALTNILPGPVGTTERRIYRTDVNGRQLYYVGKIGDNTTTTYTDYNRLPPGADPYALVGDEVIDAEFEESVLSRLSGRQQAEKRAILDAEAAERQRQRTATNLGLLADWTDHDPPPLGLEEVGILNETVFGIADGEVRFSKTAEPEHWPLGNRLKPGRNVSETALTWRAFDRDCIIYTDSALYRFSQIGLDFSDARFEEIESPVGLAGKRAIAQLDGQAGHLFLAKSGLYLFNGAVVQEVGFALEDLFTLDSHNDYINPAYMSTAILTTSRDRMYLSYGSSAANDRLLIGDFQDPQAPKFTVYQWSLTAMFRERVDNTLVAGDGSGYVYQLDTGWSNNGASIGWSFATKHFALNDGQSFALDEVFLDADLAGQPTIVIVVCQQRGGTRAATFTLTNTGRQPIRMKVPTWMKGERVHVQLSSTGAVERNAYGVAFTFMPMQEP
jgi:hypothetical protein